MNFKKTLVETGIALLEKKLTAETWGNISSRDPESGKIYMTPSAMRYDIIKEDDIIVCDIDGNILEGERKPTSEKYLHLKIYKERSDINAVIHTHAEDSLVFAVLGETIPIIIDEAAQSLEFPAETADYALPGSMELAENCIVKLRSGQKACLLKSHGAVCFGEDMEDAVKTAVVLETTARVYWKARTIGTPQPIQDDHVKFMRNFVHNEYGQDK